MGGGEQCARVTACVPNRFDGTPRLTEPALIGELWTHYLHLRKTGALADPPVESSRLPTRAKPCKPSNTDAASARTYLLSRRT